MTTKKPHELPTAILKPANNYIVRDRPRGPALKEEGELKSLTTFWLRRLRMGDVVKVGAAAPKSKVASHSIEARMADEDFGPPREPKKKTGDRKVNKGEDK